MKKTTLLLTTASLTLASVSFAQLPYICTELWRYNVGTAWFGNDNNTRGLCYNAATDTLLVPDRTPVNTVYRLNPADGTAKTPDQLDVTGVSGGTLVLNLINATSDGKLFLTNLAAPTSTFKIYSYANESAAPVTAYNETGVSVRYGDSVDLRVSGSNIELLVTGSSNANVAVFTSTDGGATFTKQDITMTPGLTGIPYAKWDPQDPNAVFVRKASSSGTETPALRRYVISGTAANQDTTFGDKLTGLAAVAAFDVKQTPNGNLIVASTYGNATAGATNLKGLIHHIPSGTLIAETATGLEASGGAVTNLNGAGAAVLDLPNNRVFFLHTNNSITGWSMPPQVASNVADWNLY